MTVHPLYDKIKERIAEKKLQVSNFWRFLFLEERFIFYCKKEDVFFFAGFLIESEKFACAGVVAVNETDILFEYGPEIIENNPESFVDFANRATEWYSDNKHKICLSF